MIGKPCTKCNEEKAPDSFRKHKTTRDGLCSWCKPCHSSYLREWGIKNRDRKLAIHKKHRDAHVNERRAAGREYVAKNAEKCKANVLQWRQKNKAHYNSYHSIRSRKVKQAVPKWADKEAIKEFYKNCPKGLEVDHIVPLLGKSVCGLHVLDNLQYLTKSENCKKSNRWGDLS